MPSRGDILPRLMTRFPFAIYFRFFEDEARILAVHHSPDPNIWRTRL